MPSAERLIEIFNEANARLPGAERERFLAESCGNDNELMEQVLALLQSHKDSDGFLKTSVFSPVVIVTERPGDLIGRYKLLEKLGEGGCGVVYVAEQTEPVRRRLALKIIKLGMDTRQVVSRFEAERQALALMDHPNIAKVLDAGSTEIGRPYFVMELVRGVKITDFCNENQLSTRERLDLFIKVCSAIQHAHQKGVIHRDIKPSNILVTLHDGVPLPKVIDFGIAKATEGRLTDATVHTQLHQLIGTPAYMSPEQVEMSGLDIDTRSDIYSLGVLLYELLTGKTPFDAPKLMASGLDAMRKTIRETDAVRPSTRLTQQFAALDRTAHKPAEGLAIPSQAEASAESRAKLRLKEQINRVRGDLDWIVMKCLEKNRAQRYDTANGLAADLNRHLNNEPVVARPPTAGYRFQKAWRRNKLVFTAAGAVAIALLLGLGVSTWLAFEAIRARKNAESEKIAALHEAYVANMFSAGPAWEEYNFQKVRQLLADTRASPDRGFEWYYWQRQTHLNLRTLYGHTNVVNSIAFFPDNQRIVTGSRDRSARVWDIATGEERLKLLGHSSWVNSVAVSPDGNQIATASSDQTVKVWDASSGQNLMTLPGHGSALNALAFSPEGRRIVTGGLDGIGRIWDVTRQQISITLEGHTNSITSVAFSPDGEAVVTGSTDQTARVWRSSDGTNLLVLRLTREIMAVAFSPDGRKIVTGSLDQVGQFWDAETGNKIPLEQLVTQEPMDTLAFSRDGRRIVTGSRNSTARVWNAIRRETELLIQGHVRGLQAAAISPDGSRVVTGGFDRSVKVWDAAGGREQLRVAENPTNSVLAVVISPDGRRMATGIGTFNNDGSTTGNGDRALQVWDSNTNEKLLTISGHDAGVSSVAFSPNGTQLLSGSGDRTAKLWDAGSGVLLVTLKGHTSSVSSVAFFPNGERIVTGSQDRTARIWNSVTGLELLVLTRHTKPISSVAVSPDGRLIATGSHDETARLWDAATVQELRVINVPDSKIYCIAFSPDSRFLAICGYEPPTVWDLRDTNRPPLTLQGHGPPVSSIAFSPDGRRIVTGGLNRIAKVWEAVTGRELLTLPGHTRFIYSVAVSLDGQRIVTGSADRTVRFWEAATTNQVAAWEVEERAAAKAGFTR